MWEGLWHAAVERYQNQKSPLSTSETPIGSRQGNKIFFDFGSSHILFADLYSVLLVNYLQVLGLLNKPQLGTVLVKANP